MNDKKKKSWKKALKKYRLEIYVTIILMAIMLAVIGISRKTNIEGNTNLERTVELTFSSLIGLISIWISCYFILIQLYKNSYPMEIIERKFLKKVKFILVFSTFVLISGILTLTILNNKIMEIYSILLFIINAIIILFYSYQINRTFTLNTYIEEYCENLEKSLENEDITEEKINNTFYDLYKLLDECFTKDEYYVCNSISEKIGTLFIELIIYANKLIMNDKKEIADYLFKKIVEFGVEQIKYVRNGEKGSIKSEIFIQQEKNIETCIKINNFEWFKKYIEEINMLPIEYKEDNEKILNNLYALDAEIGKNLLEKDDEWITWLVKRLYDMNLSLKYAYKGTNLKYFGAFLMQVMVNDEINKKGKHEILIKYLRDFTNSMTIINENIDDIVLHYSIYGSELIVCEDLENTKEFIDIITNKENRTIENERWNEFVLAYLNITMDKWKELGEENRKIIIRIVLELSIQNINCNYYSFLPKYEEIIKGITTDSKRLNQICDEFEEMIVRLIINNNVNMYYLIMRKLKNVILALEQQDRMAQEKLLDLYELALVKSMSTENKKFTEVTISFIGSTVEELDTKRNISDKLGRKIINELADIAIYRCNLKDREKDVIKITDLLVSLYNEKKKCYFILSDNKKQELLYKDIYNIGVSCIENNMENGLRNVSNSLGWCIIENIRSEDPKFLTEYIIERTKDLFKIAQNMEVSEKTLTYMMTLFTTVGTYCCKNAKYKKYETKIIDILLNENYDRVKTAIELRTNENNIWDELFDNNTKNLTKEFLSDLQKKKINVKSAH